MMKNIVAFLLITLFAISSLAQQSAEQPRSERRPTDVTTPAALLKGTPPMGSYGGGEFDNINLFNGNLSMNFPLAGLNGRGLSAAVTLSYNSKFWQLNNTVDSNRPSDTTSIYYYPEFKSFEFGVAEVAAGWTISAGRMIIRQYAGYGESDTCFFPDPPNDPILNPPDRKRKPKTTVTTLTFIAPDGTSYDFRDFLTDGRPLELLNCEPRSRGKKFYSVDATSATFVSDQQIVDYLGTAQLLATGYVYLKDGTRYRVEAGVVTQVRDRNGNVVNYKYRNVRATSNKILSEISDTGR